MSHVGLVFPQLRNFLLLFIYTNYSVTQPGLAWLGLGWAVTKYQVGVGWVVTKNRVEVGWAVRKYQVGV